MKNMFGDKNKKIKSLEEEVKSLETVIVSLRNQVADNDILNDKVAINHKLNIANYENKLYELDKTFKDRVSKELHQERKDLKIRKENQDKEHSDRMKKLDAEHTERMSRVDRKLEEDKSSYRKYLKTEYNTRLEKLEKENKSLTEENIALNVKLIESKGTTNYFSGKIDSLVELSNNIVKSLPNVEAKITTPESHVHVEPARVGNNQK